MFDFGLPAFMEVMAEPQRETLKGLATVKSYRHGQSLHEPGQPVSHMGWIESGAILFGKYLDSEGFHSLARLGPGHHFGEFGALSAVPGTRPLRRLAAVTDGPTTVSEVAVEKLAPLFRDDPEYLRAFHVVASARLGLLLELYDDARRLPARQRIINFLEIMQRLQAVDNAINCTQADISRLLGLSKVTVNQTLRKLTDQGVLRIGYGSIRFASPEHLRILSDRD